MEINPAHMIDFYKSGHIYQYPNNTELVFSNLTARASRDKNVNKIVFFGLQYFVKKYLIDEWNNHFFEVPFDDIEKKYIRRMDQALGKGSVKIYHIRSLHALGYLPIEIRAVEEGDKIDIRVPCMTIHNTIPEFFWLTNYLETILSCTIWPMITSATMAYEYRKILNHYADFTGADKDFVKFQGHDFSFRGMFGPEAAMMSGAAHLTSFVGTDTVPAIDFLEEYYGADCEKELIGCSVPATEHSVMSLGGDDDEIGTFRDLITRIYPSGIISIVSDTWDFWKVVTEYLPALKETILARDGKVVIRPDSGDPVKIICGDPNANPNSPEFKGAVECLWDTFSGIATGKGYKQLSKYIGLVYGDSITLDRCRAICYNLEKKGFASSNVVFGIGSYTYTYTTRDQYGFAVKATYAEVDGRPKNIFKKPKTDDGTKNSAKGLTSVYQDVDGNWSLRDEVKWYDFDCCDLKPVFKDGVLLHETTLKEVRERINCVEL